MAKYDPLRDELARHSGPVSLTFDEIAELVGGLPTSAIQYRAWWANSHRNPQARAWLATGRRVDATSLTAETVRFTRPSSGHAPALPPDRTQGAGPAPHPVLELPSRIATTVTANWQPRGDVVEVDGQLVFPKMPREPGVYRLVFAPPHGPVSVYIGQSSSLRRRMGNYRRPGPSQRTSRRLHDLLLARLAAGDRVQLETVTDVELHANVNPIVVDLADKATRGLVENAGWLEALAADIETHNLP